MDEKIQPNQWQSRKENLVRDQRNFNEEDPSLRHAGLRRLPPSQEEEQELRRGYKPRELRVSFWLLVVLAIIAVVAMIAYVR